VQWLDSPAVSERNKIVLMKTRKRLAIDRCSGVLVFANGLEVWLKFSITLLRN
jgi:RNase P subunit RPR2